MKPGKQNLKAVADENQKLLGKVLEEIFKYETVEEFINRHSDRKITNDVESKKDRDSDTGDGDSV